MEDKKDMISKESFDRYVRVQKSCITNMADIRAVGELSGLQKEIILDIMENYGYLEKKFKGDR